MKISLLWLGDYVEIVVPPRDLAHRLTMAGLEVESVIALGEASGVVTAEVLAAERHPDADALTLVTVSDGKERTQVVCGAPNVPPPGGKVAWARPGARLPKIGEISARKVRGILSPGMLCAEDELGLSEEHGGIVILPADTPVGSDAAALLRDTVLDINVTTNRPDCLGHLGIAREVAALMNRPLRRPPTTFSAGRGEIQKLARLRVADATGCPRYVARAIEDLTIGPSPDWVQRRLRAVGVRPISNVVDATNYVLLELGQPLHAFDLDKLAEQTIEVRRARSGERMRTLDDTERVLEPDDLLICDAKRAVAIAGVMGGLESEVSATTRRVLLESAYFEPRSIRRTAKRLGLATEASHRFERGVDPNGVAEASARCVRLLCEWAGGRAVPDAIDLYPSPVEPVSVELRGAAARRLLGISLPTERMAELLASLALEVTQKGEDRLQVVVPTFRADLGREVDLIEEIARLHGYDQFPAVLPASTDAPGVCGDRVVERARDVLRAQGLDEAITYAFIAPERTGALGLPPTDRRAQPVLIKNPLREETASLRTSLLPGLLGALRTNVDRGAAVDARLFEVGTIFLGVQGQGLPEERPMAGVLLCGAEPAWLTATRALDFFDLKGIGERVLEDLGVTGTAWSALGELSFLHPGVAAQIGNIGVGGQVHPVVAERFGIRVPCFYLELDLEGLRERMPVQMTALPRFPQISRDISFFIDRQVPAAAIAAAVEEVGEPLLIDLRVLEDYRDPERVPVGKKSMLWSMTYRSAERTLTDADAETAHARLVGELKRKLGIEQR